MEDGTDIPLQQVGALPYRFTAAGEAELLLVTSRGTRQWIIPKGWPIDGLTRAESAAREAYEEAGLLGDIDGVAAGYFSYDKVRKGDETPLRLSVEVFWLRVERQLTFWPEASQRDLVWVSPAQALSIITNPSLADLIAGVRFPSV